MWSKSSRGGGGGVGVGLCLSCRNIPIIKSERKKMDSFFNFFSCFIFFNKMDDTTTTTTTIHPVEEEKHWLTEQTKELFAKFNIGNLLFCYCLPFFYVFYPALLMPAIFLRSLSFLIGWIYKLVVAHHHHTEFPGATRRNNDATQVQKTEPPSLVEDERNNMYFWLQRCSICLDQTYSLCLESCRDQFCKDCFSR